MDPASVISQRKRDHLEMVVRDEAQSIRSAGWEDVALIPATLPEMSLNEVDLSTTFLGRRLAAPVMIASMTGGHELAHEINARLATAAERLGLAVGSGSQRAALVDSSLRPSYAVLRDEAPTAMIIANIGACQLIDQGDDPALTSEDVAILIEMLKADALAVHLNVVEELIQVEGDRITSGLVGAIASLAAEAPVPVMAKETGSGMSREAATILAGAGVAALDVGGSGGTSFARVEMMRAAEQDDVRGERLGTTFADWGLATANSVMEVAGCGVPVVATGGVRSGLDAAKALALGADLVGIGRPALLAAQRGVEDLVDDLKIFIDELRVAMVLTGSKKVADLRQPTPVLHGRVGAWADQRGLR